MVTWSRRKILKAHRLGGRGRKNWTELIYHWGWVVVILVNLNNCVSLNEEVHFNFMQLAMREKSLTPLADSQFICNFPALFWRRIHCRIRRGAAGTHASSGFSVFQCHAVVERKWPKMDWRTHLGGDVHHLRNPGSSTADIEDWLLVYLLAEKTRFAGVPSP